MKKSATIQINHLGSIFLYQMEVMEEISAGTIKVVRDSFSFEKARVVARVTPRQTPLKGYSLVCGFVQVMTRADAHYALPAVGHHMNPRRTLLVSASHPKCPCLDGGDAGVHSYYLPAAQGGVAVIGAAKFEEAEKRKTMMGFLLPEDLLGEDRGSLVLLQDSPKVPFANAGQLDTIYDLAAFQEIPERLDWRELMEDPGIPLSGTTTVTPTGLFDAKSRRVFASPLRYVKWRYEFVTWLCVKLVADHQVAVAVNSGAPGSRVAQLKWRYAGSGRFDAEGGLVAAHLDGASLTDFSLGGGALSLPGGMPCNTYIDKNVMALDTIATSRYESIVDSKAQTG